MSLGRGVRIKALSEMCEQDVQKALLVPEAQQVNVLYVQ
jgi:hypothetical protein